MLNKLDTMLNEDQGVRTPAVTAEQVEQGRVLALVGYLVTLVAIIPLVKRDNPFALFHAKQSVVLLLAAIVANTATLIAAIALAAAKLGLLATTLSVAVGLAFLAMIVLGAVNAWSGRVRPLPMIGRFAETLFGRLEAKPAAA